MASISQIKNGSTTYDIKAASATSATNATNAGITNTNPTSGT